MLRAPSVMSTKPMPLAENADAATVLVTGGAGFIGGHFVRAELQGASTIVNFDKLTYAALLDVLPKNHPRHHLVQACVTDQAAVAEAIKRFQPAAIIHFAAETHVDRSIDAPANFVATNVAGTYAVLQETLRYWRTMPAPRRDAFRFVQVSTDEVFGAIEGSAAFTEDSPYRPNSPYSATKAAGDHLARSYHQTYGLPTIITYASNNYGPNQHPEKLIPLMILNAIAGQELPVYGDGGQVRDWLHVADHCQALSRILRQGVPGRAYAVGGRCERTNLEVVQLICDLVDEALPDLAHRPTRNLIRFVEDRPGHDRRYALDCGRIERELGWRPRIAWLDGLRDTVRWFIEHPQWARDAQARRRQGLLAQGAAASPGEPT